MSETNDNSEPKKPESGSKPDKLEVTPGVLRLEDVPVDQRNVVVAKHLSEVNAKFRAQGREGETSLLRDHIKEKYGALDLADLDDILVHADTLADWAAEKAKLKTNGSEKGTSKQASEENAKAKADTTSKTDPETTITELSENTDTTAETQESPSERQARLQQFVADYFPDCPPDFINQAAGICLQYEDEYREMFEEPGLELSAEDAEDPEIRATIEGTIDFTETRDENREEIETKKTQVEEQQETAEDQEQDIKDNRPKVDAAKDKLPGLKTRLEQNEQTISRLEVKDQSKAKEVKIQQSKNETSKDRESNSKTNLNNSETNNEKAETKNETVTEDLKTVKELQSRFDSLKAEKGTIGALKSLLGPDGVKSAEMKAIVRKVLGTAQSLVAALPGKAAVVERYLNQSNINLAASSPQQVFAGFLAMADTSNEFTEEERETIRRVLGQSEKDFNSGSDAIKIAQTKEQIIDPETGEVIGERYIHDSPETMAELRPNLGTYMKGERMVLATRDGSFSRDVSGQNAEYIGMLAEVLEFYSFVQQEKGITGFVETISNQQLDGIDGQAFDYQKLIDTRQMINALMGRGEGFDGDVFDPREKSLLLSNMARVFTDDDQAIGWHAHEAGSVQILEDLGLRDNKGRPNLEVIRAFSSYAQDNLNGKMDRASVQRHLHALLPDLVTSVENDSRNPNNSSNAPDDQKLAA